MVEASRVVVAYIRQFLARRDGNVAIIFAFAALPMLLTIGAGVDYGLAMKRQGRINAAADAAALYAVTPTQMKQTSAVARLAALAFFNTQVSSLSGVGYDPSNVTMTVTDTTTAGILKRTVNVSYQASSTNTFATLLQVPTLTIKGISAATASVSPNIDFYLMLDTSPSMAIAATTDGIATMVANTKSQGGGCAFACHQTNPQTDGLSQDNYALAKQLNVTLRIDLVSQAVQNLMSTASTASSTTGAAYRVSGYTFDYAVNNVIPLTSNLATAQTQAAGIQVLQVYANNRLTSSVNNSDEDTNFDNGFSTINGAMPNPGNGSSTPGDSPQEVLFLVSDGVADTASGGKRVYTPFGPSSTWCNTIKARGIRIAVLYTTYNPLPTNDWYNTYIAPLQSTIAPAAKACASDGLFTQVDTGGNISQAITQLFATAVSTAHLTH